MYKREVNRCINATLQREIQFDTKGLSLSTRLLFWCANSMRRSAGYAGHEVRVNVRNIKFVSSTS